MKPGDKLIVLSRSHTTAPLSEPSRGLYSEAEVKAKTYQASAGKGSAFAQGRHRNIIIIGLGAQVIPDFGDDFSEFAPKGSSVTFVLPASFKAEADAALKKLPQGGNCKFGVQYVNDGNPASLKVPSLSAA